MNRATVALLIALVAFAPTPCVTAQCPGGHRPDYVLRAHYDADGKLLVEMWLDRCDGWAPSVNWSALWETSLGVEFLEMREPPHETIHGEYPEWYWSQVLADPGFQEFPGSVATRYWTSGWTIWVEPSPPRYIIDAQDRVLLAIAVFDVDRSVRQRIRLVYRWADGRATGFGSYCGGLWRAGEYDLRFADLRLPAELPFVRGDADPDGAVTLSDAVTTLRYLFAGDAELSARLGDCLDAADADDSGVVDVSDAVYTLEHLFRQGPPLAAPFPAAGIDETPDALGACGGIHSAR